MQRRPLGSCLGRETSRQAENKITQESRGKWKNRKNNMIKMKKKKKASPPYVLHAISEILKIADMAISTKL